MDTTVDELAGLLEAGDLAELRRRYRAGTLAFLQPVLGAPLYKDLGARLDAGDRTGVAELLGGTAGVAAPSWLQPEETSERRGAIAWIALLPLVVVLALIALGLGRCSDDDDGTRVQAGGATAGAERGGAGDGASSSGSGKSSDKDSGKGSDGSAGGSGAANGSGADGGSSAAASTGAGSKSGTGSGGANGATTGSGGAGGGSSSGSGSGSGSASGASSAKTTTTLARQPSTSTTASGAGSGSGSSPATGAEAAAGSVMASIAADPQLSVLAGLLRDSGLAATLEGPGPITFLAPTNDAFAQLPAATLANLRSNPEALRNLLGYHLVPAALSADSLVSGTQPTLNGEAVTIALSDAGVAVNSASVTGAELTAANGGVFPIDQVLLPANVQLGTGQQQRFALYFDVGAANPNDASQPALAQAVAAVAATAAGTPVVVTGFADVSGDPASNLALSEERATNVLAALQAANPGLGYLPPVAKGDTEAGADAAESRRVDVVIG